MAYDALAESVALIESRRLVPAQRLSRRRRFVPLGVDVDNDLAVTSFARRGVGCIWYDVHVLALRRGRWALLGGGGSNGSENPLADRAQVPTGADASALVVSGVGGIHDSRGHAGAGALLRGRWINHADLRVGSLVDSVVISGRVLPVPWHGHVIVLWAGRGRSLAVARDRAGRVVDEVVLRSSV